MENRWIFAFLLIALGTTAAPAATPKSVAIIEDAALLEKTLQELPYVRNGSGPVLYLFEFSDCPFCQNLYREYNAGNIPGVQARHVLVAVSPKSANEAAYLALSRDYTDYKLFMQKSKKAPAYVGDPKRMAALDELSAAVNETILPILKKNGWSSRTLLSPTYIWKENGTWYADGGYRKDHFEQILNSVKGK